MAALLTLWAGMGMGVPVLAHTIVVVDSYHSSYPWSRVCRQGLLEGLGEHVEPVFFEMDTKRRPEDEFQGRADAAWRVVRDLAPDLVVLMDDNAVRYLGARISRAGVPVVFMGVNDNPRRYFPNQAIPTNVTGVLEHAIGIRLIKSLARVLPLYPERFLLMTDISRTSSALIDISLGGKHEAVISGIKLETFQTGSYEAWMEKVLALPGGRYDAVILASYAALKDSQGRQVPFDDVARWTSAASKVPVFGMWDISVGKGMAVGGLVIDGREQGRNAATLVNLYFEFGELPPVSHSTRATFVFSRHELKRWGIELAPAVAEWSRFVD